MQAARIRSRGEERQGRGLDANKKGHFGSQTSAPSKQHSRTSLVAGQVTLCMRLWFGKGGKWRGGEGGGGGFQKLARGALLLCKWASQPFRGKTLQEIGGAKGITL